MRVTETKGFLCSQLIQGDSRLGKAEVTKAALTALLLEARGKKNGQNGGFLLSPKT